MKEVQIFLVGLAIGALIAGFTAEYIQKKISKKKTDEKELAEKFAEGWLTINEIKAVLNEQDALALLTSRPPTSSFVVAGNPAAVRAHVEAMAELEQSIKNNTARN